ncbi:MULTISPECIES: DUF1810 domain-containing protein [unclassified Sphingomonas]|uniref:DUF1810 domain-containing protein n=1 Tax=unclassified Sphingomonas TaxID=196159 RepID=UPI0006F9BB65|nr:MULTISPECIES: DUF1810 domain-containing protein [unclassified Sphingomonas]KQM62101.1 calpastatin [Sphingomonas sp. Leaf16]KQN13503.1 calpastatin [Sphingomonas sp. Leaf29]KQN23263.1 calpastatin [Sphingomonas sp. Leaf32]
MTDPLRRFVDAQRDSYATALAELRAGAKRGHWMWFIFPQIAGLGSSAMARQYAIADRGEAMAYLAHPLLAARLVESAEALLTHPGRDIVSILGAIDAMKLRSSMTLFEAALDGGEPVFAAILDTFYAGERDPATLARL